MVDVHHPVFARVYRGMAALADRAGLAEQRQRLLRGLVGTVVEVGCGDGANLPHYPATVTRVVAVEPEASLRRAAVRRAAALAKAEAPAPVEVVDGVAERLPLADGEADAVVLCLVLCSVADVDTALAEASRVLRPGGEVRFLEHAAAPPGSRLGAVQRQLDRRVWPALFGGCHTHRDPVASLERAGFTVTRVHRAMFPERPVTPVSPHAVGVAVRA